MYDFTGVATEDGLRVPPPGTIAVFNILSMKEENVSNMIPEVGKKVYITIEFGNDEYTFDERFYMLDWKSDTNTHSPHQSMKRIHHLYHRLTEQELANTTFQQLKAGLIGKQVALAITANVRNTDEGPKAYSQIKYMNFARKPQEMAELKLSTKDLEEVAKYNVIREQQSASNADPATPSDPVAGMPAGAVPTPDNKF